MVYSTKGVLLYIHVVSLSQPEHVNTFFYVYPRKIIILESILTIDIKNDEVVDASIQSDIINVRCSMFYVNTHQPNINPVRANPSWFNSMT